MGDLNRIMPVVTLQLDSMRASIKHAMSLHGEEYQQLVQQAIDEAFSADAVVGQIRAQAKQIMAEAIKEQLKTYFQYGEGRNAIQRAIDEVMQQENHHA